MRKINAGLGLSTMPQVILLSGGGKITVSLIQENHHDHVGQTTSSNRTTLDDHDGDDVGTMSKLSDIPPAVHNPTPLRWYRPPEANFNGVDDHHVMQEVMTNSDKYPPHVMIQEKYFPRHDPIPIDRFDIDGVEKYPQSKNRTSKFLDDRDVHVVEVDTILRLSNYVSRNPNIIPPLKKIINQTPNLRWFHPDFFDGVEDDEVDTTLSLRPPCSTNNMKSRKLGKGKRRADADVEAGEDRLKKRKTKGSNNGDDEDQRPLIPIELIPGLREILSDGGARPTFLYRKKLEDSDVKRGQNRLFVTRRERMMEFLTEEEAAAVDGGGTRLKIVGVDGGGKVYDELALTKWESLNMTVINSDWWKLVDENNAEKGDVVEIWGYRQREKPHFAFNFRRESNGVGENAAVASSSGTTCIDEGTTPQV